MQHFYNIIQQSCVNDSSIVLNHEPMRKSACYEAKEILRRSYQNHGFKTVTEGNGFIVADAVNFLYHIYSEEVEVQK